MSRLPPPAIAPLLWAFAALLLAQWPLARAAAPVFGLLRGPLALVLVGVAVAASLARAGRREGAPWPDPGAFRLFLAAALAFLTLGLFYATRLRVSGDEPHYLVMARSLYREGDLDLRDNYEREDWRADTPGPVRPHYGAPRKDGRPFPAHSPGLPLLLALPDAAFGRLGCVAALALLAAWLVAETRALALRATGDPAAAAFGAVAAAGPPLAAYAFHVYTEVPSALAVAVALRLLVPEATVRGGALAAAATATLPWLHVKMGLAAVALGLVALWRLRGRARLAFCGVAAAAALAYAAYYVHVFGQPTPLAIYGGVPQDASGAPARAVLGLLLDRSFGLLPHAPVYLLALAALPLLARLGRTRADLERVGPFALVGLAVLLPILPWRMWWGGQCPPARFLVPLVPLLAVAVAARVAGPPRGLARWRAALLVFGAALLLFAIADPGRLLLLSRAHLRPRLWDGLAGALSPAVYLPWLTRPDPAEWRVAAVWGVALATLVALDVFARRHDRVDRLFRGLGLPLLMAASLGLVIDHWARAGARPAAAPLEAPLDPRVDPSSGPDVQDP